MDPQVGTERTEEVQHETGGGERAQHRQGKPGQQQVLRRRLMNER
jgi:hypothetical protein